MPRWLGISVQFIKMKVAPESDWKSWHSLGFVLSENLSS
jgi:hypothetical protein